jgi:hypothetical protein
MVELEAGVVEGMETAGAGVVGFVDAVIAFVVERSAGPLPSSKEKSRSNCVNIAAVKSPIASKCSTSSVFCAEFVEGTADIEILGVE